MVASHEFLQLVQFSDLADLYQCYINPYYHSENAFSNLIPIKFVIS